MDSLKLKLAPALRNLSQRDVKYLCASKGMVKQVKTYFPRNLLTEYSPIEIKATVKELIAEQLFAYEPFEVLHLHAKYFCSGKVDMRDFQ